MDRALIKKLSEAGVTPEVIVRLLLDEPEKLADPAPGPEPKPEPAPGPEPKPEPKPDPKPELQSDKILAAIERLTGAVQASNIMNFSAGDPKGESVDDILAEMLTPKKGA